VVRIRLQIALLAATAFGQSPDTAFFETRVRPVLVKHCLACHGAEKQFAGLRLDAREHLLQGGKRGAALVPGRPAESLLLKAVRHETGLMPMPPGAQLDAAQVRDLEQWIAAGAVWPTSATKTAASKAATNNPEWYDQAVRTHWSFQPLRKSARALTVDDHLSAARSAQGLTGAPPAEKSALLRRASFILTGLPPTAQEVAAFLADESPQAYSRVVDRLLASPHFGEHWARHWMDVVRYGETRGYEWNYEVLGAWRYRDYLIRAFQQDVPYNQFVREHIAGDLLERPRVVNGVNESILATAFYRLGEAGHDDCIQFREISLDVVDNQIDTVTKAFQGMTVACARCHAHKLDPIPTEDYYGLFGVLNSSRAQTHTANAAAVPRELRETKQRIRTEIARVWRDSLPALTLPSRAPGKTNAAHPLFAWWAMRNTADFAPVWRDLQAALAAERDRRREHNRAQFTPVDLRTWHASGLGLQGGATAAGDFTIGPDATAITAILPAGFHTHTWTARWNGALRSPLLGKEKKFLSLRVVGGRLAARRAVLDNCAIGEGYKVLEQTAPGWVTLDTLAKHKLPVFAEIITKHDNPRIPDRPGMLKVSDAELRGPHSFFGVMQAVLHDGPAPPREEMAHLDRLWASPVASESELLARYRTLAAEVIDAWAQGRATDGDVRWLEALLPLLPNAANSTPLLSNLLAEYREREAKLPAPEVIDGLGDAGPGFDAPVLRAGDAHAPGALAPRQLLSRIGPDRAPLAPRHGSGRRELAERIASPANPLTARLMVNRIWSHVFGRGLVTTVDNFGQEGEPPSHPDLLDDLATRFVRDGWRVKKLVRELVLTQAFQQATQTTDTARRVDPRNRLLHHYPLRRLPAESIHDAILAASGRLDRTLFGPSIPPARLEAQDYRRLFNGPLDGYGRRAIYTQITRMEGPKFLEIFDYPNPMAARGARDVTNVPAQALALLNDPFVKQQARVWAERLAEENPADRLGAMFVSALGRPPSNVERERFTSLAAELASLEQAPRDSVAVWSGVAHAIFNLKEFVYLP